MTLGGSTAPPPPAGYSLWTWGANYDGQLGLGDNNIIYRQLASPVQVGADTNWIQTSNGNSFSAALRLEP